MRKRIELSIFVIIGILIITLLGTAFAFFSASTSGGGNNIEGETFDFGASISLTTIYRATNLVPLQNNLVTTAISKQTNKCIDKNNRDVCSLYSITLSNNGDNVNLNPYITTTSSTYTTNNLKCQLFNNSFTAVSDVITISNSANGKVYITSSGNNVSINLTNTSKTYYLAIWLTDTLSSQSADYSKAFSGTITFDAGNNGQVYVDFTA